MATTANFKEYHKWTDSEVAPMLKAGSKPFKLKHNPSYHQAQSAQNQIPNLRRRFQINPTTPNPYFLTNIAGLASTASTNTSPLNNNTANNFPRFGMAQTIDNTSRLLTDLTKLYNDKKKFGGKLYNTFDSKFKIFCDDCLKIGLPDYMWNRAFSTMLKGRAATYYYNHIAGHNYLLDTMIHMMREHFHTKENRQLYLFEQRETTLLQMIAQNPGKPQMEVL